MNQKRSPIGEDSPETKLENDLESNTTIDRPQRTLRSIALQFLLGLVGGGLLLIPLSYSNYFTFSSLSITQLTLALVFPLGLGTLAALRGDRFRSFLSKLLDSFPSI